MPSQAPKDYNTLNQAITSEHSKLSKRLRQVAVFALEHPTVMALETIANIAESAQVQPSTLIRFAKAFDYKGFSEMQRIFQSYVTLQSASYKERIHRDMDGKQHDADSPSALLQQYCQANIVSLEHLQTGVPTKDLNKAIKLLRKAKHVYIIGQRRSFPISTYLAYTLNHVDCRAHLLDGSGGLLKEQISMMAKGDVLIASSFHPYSAETIDAVATAAEKGVASIAITDSGVSPIANNSTVCFNIHDAEVHNFRSLTASMLLAQTLATSLLFNR